MGSFKKYEAHARYPCCCCALDVKVLAYCISVVGLVFSLAASMEALLYSTRSGFLLSLFYTFSFGAIIFGVVSEHHSYLILFLILNGTCIALQGLLVFIFSVIVAIGPDQFNLREDSLIWAADKQLWLDQNTTKLTVDSYEKTYELSMLLVWMGVLLTWLVNVIVQGIIFHTYRSMQLRKKLEYRPYDKTAPISHLSNTGGGGLAYGNPNNYISTIKRPVCGT